MKTYTILVALLAVFTVGLICGGKIGANSVKMFDTVNVDYDCTTDLDCCQKYPSIDPEFCGNRAF